MRRWLIVLVLFVMPFQMVWAAAAPYCAHEAAAADAAHFGHHEHRHHGGAKAAAAADEAATPFGADADCGACQFGASVSLPAAALVVAVLPHPPVSRARPPRYDSHVPAGPERPDRSVLAAAARSAGGVESGLHPI